MHIEAKDFTVFVKGQFPEFFTDKMVLDVGSGDINGNNKFLFDSKTKYIGNDVFNAPNVNIVCKTSALPFADNTFDTIISTECFEHDPEYLQSIQKICKMLKPGGLFVFTCASTGRGEHGTRRTTPENSFGAIGSVETWQDHYRNLTIDDVHQAVNIDETFSVYRSYYQSKTCDLYFWGIKKGGDSVITSNSIEYVALNTTNVYHNK